MTPRRLIELTVGDGTGTGGDEVRAIEVCGSYPGAIPQVICTDEAPAALARRLCRIAGCDCYTIDGVTYAATVRTVATG